MLRRRFIGRDNLPSIYQRVNYIESNGNTYITLNITADLYTYIETSISYPSNQGILFGQDYILLQFNRSLSPPVIYAYGGSGGNQLRANLSSWNDFAEVECKMYPNEQYCKLNGVLLGSTTFASDYTTPYYNQPYSVLFARNLYGENKIACKLRYFKLYNGSNKQLVRDLVPVKRSSDNRVGMWDFVSKAFYTDANGYLIFG